MYNKEKDATMKIIYDSEFKDKVIEIAGLKVGKNKYLIEKKTNKPIKTINGEFVKYDNFGGFRKGSVEVIKSDLTSLIAYSKRKRKLEN